MKKKINDILLDMQIGKICVGDAANKLMNLVRISKIEKPPIGVVPKGIYDNQRRLDRVTEILAAIVRYSEAKLEINQDWIDEYNALVVEIREYNNIFLDD